jgi:hypothetical protein
VQDGGWSQSARLRAPRRFIQRVDSGRYAFSRTSVAAKPLNQIPLEVGDSGLVPVFDPTPAYSLVNIYLGYQPIANVVAAVPVENSLNVDYTKYMCCSSAAGYVVPSPGITFKGSLTIRYGVKGDS